ncbi:MAG: Tfp pilus assembly protein PilF [Gammaproteobacteria bacterium]|jgi:Tfp pilus assembly protein PilF
MQNSGLFISLILSIVLMYGESSLAASGNYSSDVDLTVAMQYIDEGDFGSAINELHDELDSDPDNPDILSLLGFSYRNIGSYVDAMEFYEWALKSEPEHKGANEYLGELYLQINQLDNARKQLAILNDLCFLNCDEYNKLKSAIEEYLQ